MHYKMTPFRNNKGVLAIPEHFMDTAVDHPQAFDDDRGLAVLENGRFIVKAGTIFPSNDESAIGIVKNDVDVTDGDGTLVIITHGIVNVSKIEPLTDNAKAALGSAVLFAPFESVPSIPEEPEIPDPEDPDPEIPDPEDPDPEIPDPEDPDPEIPDPEDPDPEIPDPEDPYNEHRWRAPTIYVRDLSEYPESIEYSAHLTGGTTFWKHDAPIGLFDHWDVVANGIDTGGAFPLEFISEINGFNSIKIGFTAPTALSVGGNLTVRPHDELTEEPDAGITKLIEVIPALPPPPYEDPTFPNSPHVDCILDQQALPSAINYPSGEMYIELRNAVYDVDGGLMDKSDWEIEITGITNIDDGDPAFRVGWLDLRGQTTRINWEILHSKIASMEDEILVRVRPKASVIAGGHELAFVEAIKLFGEPAQSSELTGTSNLYTHESYQEPIYKRGNQTSLDCCTITFHVNNPWDPTSPPTDENTWTQAALDPRNWIITGHSRMDDFFTFHSIRHVNNAIQIFYTFNHAPPQYGGGAILWAPTNKCYTDKDKFYKNVQVLYIAPLS